MTIEQQRESLRSMRSEWRKSRNIIDETTDRIARLPPERAGPSLFAIVVHFRNQQASKLIEEWGFDPNGSAADRQNSTLPSDSDSWVRFLSTSSSWLCLNGVALRAVTAALNAGDRPDDPHVAVVNCLRAEIPDIPAKIWRLTIKASQPPKGIPVPVGVTVAAAWAAFEASEWTATFMSIKHRLFASLTSTHSTSAQTALLDELPGAVYQALTDHDPKNRYSTRDSGTYLSRVDRILEANYVNPKKERTLKPDLDPGQPDEDLTPEEYLLTEETRQDFERLIKSARLSPQQTEVLGMMLNEFEIHDIAESLDVTTGAVKQQQHRLKQKIRSVSGD